MKIEQYKKLRKYAIRKLAIGAVSAFLGCSVFGVEAKANETRSISLEKSNENINVKYISVDEKDLTIDEKKLIINKEEFAKEIADDNKNYILVYKAEELKTLPNTGILNSNFSKLLALGLISLVLVGIRKSKKKTIITIIAVTTMGSAINFNVNESLAQSGIVAKLVQNHSHSYKNNLKNPLEKIDNLIFYGYIKENDIKEGTRLYKLINSYKSEDNKKLDKEIEIVENKTDKEKLDVVIPATEEKEIIEKPTDIIDIEKPADKETSKSEEIENEPTKVSKPVEKEETTLETEKKLEDNENKETKKDVEITDSDKEISQPTNKNEEEKNNTSSENTNKTDLTEPNDDKIGNEELEEITKPVDKESEVTNNDTNVTDTEVDTENNTKLTEEDDKKSEIEKENTDTTEEKEPINDDKEVSTDKPNENNEVTNTEEPTKPETEVEKPSETNTTDNGATETETNNEEDNKETEEPTKEETTNSTDKVNNEDNKNSAENSSDASNNQDEENSADDEETSENTPEEPKEKPTITINSLDNEALVEEKTILLDSEVDQTLNLNYSINENNAQIISKKYKLTKDGIVIKEGELAENLPLNNLDYGVDYKIETILEYNIGNGIETTSDIKTFNLELKKIEIKDIKEYRLIKREKENHYIHLLNLREKPTSYDNYFVEIKSSKNKTILLPVTNIELENDKYKVTMDIDDLVENENGAYKKTHDFYINKNISNEYSTFKDLVTAIKQNPAGTFVLNNDISASEIYFDENNTDKSYFDGITFTGTLTGKNNDKNFAIFDLSKPLFNSISNAKIENIDFKNVNIFTNKNSAAAISLSSVNSNFNNVAVEGEIYGQNEVGGLVSNSQNTTFTNVLFKGILQNLSSISDIKNTNIGGIVGNLRGGKIDKAYVDAYIQLYGENPGSKAGIIAGKAGDSNPKITNVVGKGIIENRVDSNAQVGGLVGSLWGSGRVENAISAVKVINGNLIYGDAGDKAKRIHNVYTVENLASGKKYLHGTDNITLEKMNEKISEWGITAALEDSSVERKSHNYSINYENNENLHKNIEKFIPFYNKMQIEKYAKLVMNNDLLLNKKILSITPMIDNKIVSSISDFKETINKIMVNLESDEVKYYNVTFSKDFNKYLPEYNVTDLGIIYTPDILVSNYNKIIETLKEEFNKINYTSEEFANILSAYKDSEITKEKPKEELIRERMRDLHLEDSFNEVKANIDKVLKDLLASDKMINVSDKAIQSKQIEKIVKNKEYIIAGLSYLTRWYAINFKDINIKDLVIYHQDFDGKNIETVDWLIKLGKRGYKDLQLKNNLITYKSTFSDGDSQKTIMQYLEKMNSKLSKYETMNEWFKSATTAKVTEANLGENNEIIVKIYDKMSREGSFFNYTILPLLTSKEGIFAIATANSISFGMYDRYMDMSLKDRDIEKYKEEIKKIEAMIDKATEHQRIHYNFWYKMVKPEYKEKLVRDIPSWDGYLVRGKWLTRDDANQAMKDFFLPLERYYRGNGAGAYADGSATFFVNDAVLTNYGTAVFTHEMVHNNDGPVYFNGEGRRNNIGAEYFALGLLQVPHAFNDPALGINNTFDFSEHKDDIRRIHNISPDRLSTPEKIHDYYKKMFDILYTLDYAEGEAILTQGKENYMKLFNKITTVNGHNSGNVRIKLPENIELRNINDLIDNDVISSRYGLGDKDDFNYLKTNGYYKVKMFSPIYSGGENKEGAAGDLMFRRMAFEIMAYKGYNDGFLSYISNKLHKQAVAEVLKKVTDTFAIKTISNGEFNSMAEFKKEMFKQRYEKRNQLKEITIEFNGKEIVIDSYDKLYEIIKETVESDIRTKKETVTTLKHRIYNAYLRLTNDFEDSIYKNE